MAIVGKECVARARRLHERALVIDTHLDTTQRLAKPEWDIAARHGDGHVDIPRLKEGGVDGAFFAVWARGPVEPGAGIAAVREQMDWIRRTIARHPDSLAAARTADDIRRAKSEGRIAIPIAIEGGYLLEESLDFLRECHRQGAVYLTLTHGFHTTWADSSGVHEPLSPLHGGLTDFGREVVAELNLLGMMVDVSHAGDKTFWDVIETSAAPVVATHSSCRAVSPHRRNLTDDMIRAVADSGGVVQINFAAGFIDPHFPTIDPKVVQQWYATEYPKAPFTDHVTPLSLLVDHFDHALKLVGPDHVGIGSDFDGVAALPSDMEDCSKLVNLTAALLERGYGEDDLGKVLGENVLRVMEACEGVGRRLGEGHSCDSDRRSGRP